ncbi:MAG TPA: GGDEF domain-containing protein [Vulgatibacter sp.]|nr:GGDEF domain-containing protein [Vulgatibacter sp.]
MKYERGQETTVIRTGTGANQLPSSGGAAGSLVIIYGAGMGRLIPVDGTELLIGRDQSNHVVVEQESVSRRHCVVRTKDGALVLQDLGSTNGTFLNDEEVRPPREAPLRSGDLIKVGGTIFKYLGAGSVEALYHEEIYRMAIIDGLTEVNNRRYLMEFLEREMARCSRHDRPLSLLLFDLDRFKNINEEHGHLAGDAVLREIATLVRTKMIRREELIARYGGDEFAIVLPESTIEHARLFAKRLLGQIAARRVVFDDREIAVSISIGIAAMSREFTEPSQFIDAADANLLTAKRFGRGRTIG